MTKIKFTKKGSIILSSSLLPLSIGEIFDVNIQLEVEPFSFDTTGFENNPCSVAIKSIRFVDFKDKYCSKGLDALLDRSKKNFELEFDKDRTQFYVIRGDRLDNEEDSKLHINLFPSTGELVIGVNGGFLPDIATLTAVAEEPPIPPRTVRKHCDECQKGSLHEEIEGEELCLPCDWKTLEDYWKNMIEEYGFGQAKEDWETIRDSEKNKAILQKLNDEEKQQWLKVVVPKIDRVFIKKQNDEQPTNHLPYILAIGGMLLVVMLFIFVLQRKNKNR